MRLPSYSSFPPHAKPQQQGPTLHEIQRENPAPAQASSSYSRFQSKTFGRSIYTRFQFLSSLENALDCFTTEIRTAPKIHLFPILCSTVQPGPSNYQLQHWHGHSILCCNVQDRYILIWSLSQRHVTENREIRLFPPILNTLVHAISTLQRKLLAEFLSH